jgi:hypothetical protein
MLDENPTREKIRYQKPADFEPLPCFEDGSLRCMAFARTTGEQCKMPPMKGKNTCRMHGAKGGRPRERFKVSLFHDLQELCERALLSEDAIFLKTEIGINAARIQQLTDQLENLDRIPVAEEIKKEIDHLITSMLVGNQGKAFGHAEKLKKLVEPQAIENDIWRQLNNQLMISERLAKSDAAITAALEQSLPARDIARVIEIFKFLVLACLPEANRRLQFMKLLESYTVKPLALPPARP